MNVGSAHTAYDHPKYYVGEVAPPGWGHTKAEKEKTKPDKPKSKIGGSAAAFDRARKEGRFKGSKEDMFKLMWWMKNKGGKPKGKPHYKPGTDEKYKKYQEESVREDKGFDDFRLTLKTHKELNPQIWTDKKLDPEIATNLIKIGKEWAKFAEIPEDIIDDYIIVGGNANFNYTKYSDIDLHLVIDKKKLGCEGLLDDFLRAKKQLWALTHNITIKGHPVELYAQDIEEKVGSKGQYSLNKKKWIQEPTPYELNRKDPEVVKKVKDFIFQIDTLIDAKSDDRVVFQNLKDRLGTMRKAAIQKAGEYAPENLVFKELRNRGYLEKVSNYLRDLGDKELSVESTMPNVDSKDRKYIKARAKNLFKKDIKGTVSGVNEADEKSYEKFIRQARERREAIKKRGEESKKRDAEYVDRVKKGIKFYDKKGSGRIVGGRKKYD